jgi:hypothetical protein
LVFFFIWAQFYIHQFQVSWSPLCSHAANLWHWLGRPDCPLAIQECKKLFDK